MEADGQTAKDDETEETLMATYVMRKGRLTELGKGERLKSGGRVSWPMRSRGAGVHVNQVAEMERQFPGCKWDRRTGEAIFDSPSHKKASCKARGLIDLDGVWSGRHA